MYSKANYRDKNDIIIPENYRGNAFFGRMVDSDTVKASPEENEQEAVSCEPEIREQETQEPSTNSASNSLLSSLLPPKVSKPSGILSNIGLEEMLIVGVLVLLSQSDADDDILLLLFLLLFYK